MKTLSEPQNPARLTPRLRAATQTIGITVALIGVVVILGWVFDISALKSILPGLPTMKVNTALCISLGGISLWLRHIKLPLRKNKLKGTLRHVSIICAALIILITVLSLLQYGFQVNLGIDQLLMQQPEPVGSTALPGRMAPNTAFTLLLIGSALLFKTRLSQSLMLQGFAIAAWSIAFVALLGHIYGSIYFFTAGSYSGMALHTAVACLLLSTGILCAHPQRGIMRLFVGEGTGSTVARRLLPLAIILPPFIWGICEAGERWHLYDTDVKAALASTLNILIFAGLIIWNAAKLNTIDQRRRRAELALQQTNIHLEQQRAELLKASDRLQMELFERERTERALQLSQARFAGILEVANDAIISINPQQVITLFNQGAEKIFGYKAEEVLGQPLDLLLPSRFAGVHGQHVNYFNQADGEASHMGEHQEIFGRRKNGTEFPAEASISKLEVGNETIFTAFLRDISQQQAALRDRKQAQIALQHYVSEVADLYNQAPCGYHSLDENGGVIRVNDTELAWLGYTRGEIIGKNMLDLLTPNSREIFRENFPRFKQQGWLKGVELEMIRSDGTILPVMLNATAIKDPKGKYVRSRSTIYDISDFKQIEIERKQAQKALQRYERIVSATIDAIALIDCNYIYRIVNQSYLGLHQKSEEDFLGHSVAEVLGKEVFEATIKPRLDRCIRGQNIEFELWDEYPNLGRQFLSVTYTPYREVDQTISGVVVVLRNLTKLKQAEQALHESEERLQLAMEASGDGLWDWNLTTDEVYYSPRYLEMLGYAADEFPQDVSTWERLVHPDDMLWVKDILAAHFQYGSVSYNFDYRVRTKSGEWKWVADYGKVVLRDEDGKPLRMIGTHRDINDRKRAEEALQHSEEKFRSAFEDAAIGMALVVTDGHWLKVNPALCELTGYSESELLTLSFQDITHPEDLETALSYTQQLLRGEIRTYQMEKRYFHKQGHIIWILLNKSLVRDEREKPLYFIAQIEDISVRKRMEIALRESEERWQLALRGNNDGIWDWNIKTNEVFFSTRWKEMLGFEDWEIANNIKEWRQRIHPDDLEWVTQAIQDHFAGKTPFYITEHRVLCKKGTYKWILDRGQAVWDDAGNPIRMVGSHTDISDRKRIELELQHAKEAAEAANQAKSIFLANMSHELRTPLNVILGFTQVMNRDPSFTPEQQENVRIIHRSGEHLLSLINDILDLSKIEAGRTELEENSFDLIGSLTSIQQMFCQRAQAKGLQFNLELSSNLPQYITVDFTKLRQVLINLLSNGIKFTEKGSVTLRVKMIAGNKAENFNYQFPITNYQLQFEVEDTGVGITANELNTIFAPFTQAQAGKRSQEGTGLGLAISRQFVRLMHGELQVRSIPSQGTLFHFSIPVQIAQAADVPQIQKPRHVIGLAPEQPQYRILVVDDQPENRQLLVKLLQPLGLEVREAADGETAIAWWQQWQPHLIWMDIRMSGIDGYEATQHIRATTKGQSVVIIALTAQASRSDRTLALAAGCNDFLCKPFEESVLFTKMAEHLGVRYLYADDDQQLNITCHNQLDPSKDLTPENLLVMPSQWIELLHQAAVQCDDEAIEQLIQQIPLEQGALIAGLKHLNRHYQFKAIAQLTSPRSLE